MAASKRPLEEVDVSVPSPQRLKMSKAAGAGCTPLSSTLDQHSGDPVSTAVHISTTEADIENTPPAEIAGSGATATCTNTNLEAAPSTHAPETATPEQSSVVHQPDSGIVDDDDASAADDANVNVSDTALLHAGPAAAEAKRAISEAISTGNETVPSSEVVGEVQALWPSEPKLRRMREAMESLPNHIFTVLYQSTFHGHTGTGIMATETTFDAAFEAVVADAEAESYENYATADEDSDIEPEVQAARRRATGKKWKQWKQWKQSQSNRERLIRIARISTRGSITFSLIDDQTCDDQSLYITIARRPVGSRGNGRGGVAL